MARRGGALLKGLLIAVIVGGVGYAVYWRVMSEKEEEGAGTAQASTSEQAEAVEGLFQGVEPIPVKATPTELGTLVQTVHAEGRAQPARQIGLTAQVNGILERLRVKEGDFVREGQILMDLEDEQYRLTLQNEQSNLLEAQARYAGDVEQRDARVNAGLDPPPAAMSEAELAEVERRFRQAEQDLLANRITLLEFRDIELEYQAARILAGKERGNIQKAEVTRSQIRVQRAQRDLEHTKVKAPFTGRVADLEVVPGQYVGASTVLLTLLDVSTMQVDVDVLESEISPIVPGRKAEVEFTALGDEVLMGRVISVNPIIDPQSRTGKVTLELDNPQGRITPGMFARSRIFSRDIENVMMVPHESIVERDDRTLVFAVEVSENEDDPDIVKWRYVVLGESNDTHVIVHPTDDPHAGVRAGMLVCVEGHVSLQHDSPVKLVETIPSNILLP
jgi:RND family efflux transporter MFP subunit